MQAGPNVGHFSTHIGNQVYNKLFIHVGEGVRRLDVLHVPIYICGGCIVQAKSWAEYLSRVQLMDSLMWVTFPRYLHFSYNVTNLWLWLYSWWVARDRCCLINWWVGRLLSVLNWPCTSKKHYYRVKAHRILERKNPGLKLKVGIVPFGKPRLDAGGITNR